MCVLSFNNVYFLKRQSSTIVPTCTNSLIEFSNSYIRPLTNSAHAPLYFTAGIHYPTYVRHEQEILLKYNYLSPTNQQSTHFTSVTVL